MIEKLFERLDKKAKELQLENGHSFIENLGLSMEELYMNDRALLEQSTTVERRKAFQFAYLSMLKEEMIQPNHQMTPDSIGYLVSYLVRMFMGDDEQAELLDMTSGTGHLSATVHEQNPDKKFTHYLVEVDPVLARLSVHLSNFLEIPFNVYPQDAIMPLAVSDMDLIIGDLPVGYYPVDERSHQMTLGFEEGHSFSHHLLIEQAVHALKPGGLAFLVVPSQLFEHDNVQQLQKFIATETIMQAFLNFPSSLFKTESTRKSLLILERKSGKKTPPVEVLLANIPDFKDEFQMRSFLDEMTEWFKSNRNKK
ncbi:class I SAM-dependent methyltransferase [Macrococcus equipercicus]|uniref:Class I SAM-dependent methyltransferase n=1 Tax=Macrococcus equipercicus TaxID=69967 RepID=A0A9Q9BMC2_9STAP|nr:class I SAM-dependent methyltransferase [Macrococcus equipercicus]KAA1038443.1 class I SAM-dependent methyltransferase [Macrococcus equipercicus]UTH13170.1 class I SAM-dependent methyltransferase [Macrococcus equipercicus]